MKLNELVAKMSMTCAVCIERFDMPEVSEIVYNKSAYSNSVTDMKSVLNKYGEFKIRYINVRKNFLIQQDHTYEEPCLHICIGEEDV